MIPNDPVMLLSFVNTNLRDHDKTLDEFCQRLLTDKETLIQKLGQIDYHYDEARNQFI